MSVSTSNPVSQPNYHNAVGINKMYDVIIELFRISILHVCHQQVTIYQSHNCSGN